MWGNSIDSTASFGREFQLGVPVRLVHAGYAYLSGVLVLATGPVDSHDGMVGVTWEAAMRGRGDEMLHGVRVPPDWIEVLGPPMPTLPGWLLRSRLIRDRLTGSKES